MSRMECLLFCLLLLTSVSQHRSLGQDGNQDSGQDTYQYSSDEPPLGPGFNRDSGQDQKRGKSVNEEFGQNNSPDQDRDRHDGGDDRDRGRGSDGDRGRGDDGDRGRGDDGDRGRGDDGDRGRGDDGDRGRCDNGDRGRGDDGDRGRGDDGDQGRGDDGNRGRGDNGDRGRGDDGDRGRGDDGDRGRGDDGDRGRGDDGDRGRGDNGDRGRGDDGDRGRGDDGDRGRGDDGGRGRGDDGDRGRGDDGDRGRGDDGDRGRGDDGDRGRGDNGDRGRGDDGDRGTGHEGDRGRGCLGDQAGVDDGDGWRDNDGDLGRGGVGDERKGKDDDDDDGDDDDDDDDEHDDEGSDPAGNQSSGNHQNRCEQRKNVGIVDARFCMEDVNNILMNGHRNDTMDAIESLEEVLKEVEVNESVSVSVNNLVALVHKPKGPFTGLEIYANDNEASSDKAVTNSKVRVWLPEELKAGSNNKIVFCMLTWPNWSQISSEVLYENRLVSLSVQGKNISGLQDRVIITTNLSMALNGTQEPKCVFLNFSTGEFSTDGCLTIVHQTQVTCSCDHLTYFGVLMVSVDLSSEHVEILSYITLIGCSLSLLGLLVTVLLFITKRKVRSDVSMKVHIHLAVALLLLNVHFLPSQAVAAMSSTGLCLYIAISLHYFLLASFSWMALEGFHLYLLLVRVFNIYIRKYLLKLSLVGWGVPAVIVSLVVVINRDSYGIVPLDSKTNSTEICYIANDTVKMVTTVGVFSLVLVLNLIMLGVTVRQVMCHRLSKQIDQDRAKRNICTLLGVTVLLGIPWGLVFFSFGHLTVPGLYIFCILNTLQGFFIFLWFVMSLTKIGGSAAKTGSVTRSTNT